MTTSTTQLANAIRFLSMDAVQAAKSGHPGAPMGMADMAYALWGLHLKHNPKNPAWFDRDRFVLSNGHASMLIYSLLHLTGYDVSVQDLKDFRQLHSKTPGHPEVGVTAGVDTSTGPLGQGIGNAVGFALAEKLLATEFNRPGYSVVDHFTYCFLGDGCLMEGISHEVASLAGTLKLSKLIVMYDSNGISIDGQVQDWFSEDIEKRFQSYGWQVIADVDGHDVEAMDKAIATAKEHAREDNAGPTLIICNTVIGKGSPNKAGTSKVHGAPLGDEEIALIREQQGWNYGPFEIPQDVYDEWSHVEAGQADNELWDTMFADYTEDYPELSAELTRRMNGDLPVDFAERVAQYVAQCNTEKASVATRAASQKAIAALVEILPEMIGGSADLTGSNLTNWPDVVPVRAHQAGRHINYGVREFGMSAMMNGMALHGGYIPFGATFLSFSDYSRNAIRMAALMKQRVVYVFTHDSIGVGEDGPTHQPNEHVAALRLIPNLDVWRPCDTVETAIAWQMSVAREQSVGMSVKNGGPSVLALSRQGVPFIERTHAQIDAIVRGAYVLRDVDTPQVILMATGSEVHLAVEAATTLAEQGIAARVVSAPCLEVFDSQDEAYRTSVLPEGVPLVAIEAGATASWYKYLQGRKGAVLGIDVYGESAPAKDLFNLYGITADKLVEAVKNVI